MVNDLLMTKIFLWVYELRKKFCYLNKKVPKKKNIIKRDFSACVDDHFIGFEMARKNKPKYELLLLKINEKFLPRS